MYQPYQVLQTSCYESQTLLRAFLYASRKLQVSSVDHESACCWECIEHVCLPGKVLAPPFLCTPEVSVDRYSAFFSNFKLSLL